MVRTQTLTKTDTRQIASRSPAGQRTASTASAPSASWPTGIAPPTSRSAGRSSKAATKASLRRPRRHRRPARRARPPPSPPVRIAVASCASSGACRAAFTGPVPARRHSPASRHEPARSDSAVFDRSPRSCPADHARQDTSSARGAALLVPAVAIAGEREAPSACRRHRPPPERASDADSMAAFLDPSRHRQTQSPQTIPIEPAQFTAPSFNPASMRSYGSVCARVRQRPDLTEPSRVPRLPKSDSVDPRQQSG